MLPPAPAGPSRLLLPLAGPRYDDQDPDGVPRQNQPGCAAARPDPPGLATGAPPGPDGEWPSRFAQALAEALAGSRPPRQVAAWTTGQARRRIAELGPLLRAGPRPVVRRVLTSEPRRDVIEMTVILGVGPRIRAIAVRLERPDRDHPGWVCTAIEAA
jgi:hypothetical protein